MLELDHRDTFNLSIKRARYPTTCWTVIEDVQQREILKAEFCGLYWSALYMFARRKGFANDDAKDFTQGFLTEILLGQDFLGKADRTRGRFRSLLIKAFDNYIKMILRKKKVPLGIDSDLSEYELPDTVPLDPGAAFDYVWATKVLNKALTDLAYECEHDDLSPHWAVFQQKVLSPIFEGTAAPSMEELCTQHGIESESRASNMIVTVKRRFHKIISRYLSQGQDHEQSFPETLEQFMGIFMEARA